MLLADWEVGRIEKTVAESSQAEDSIFKPEATVFHYMDRY